MKDKFAFLHSKKISVVLFVGFAILNLYYFIKNFIVIFLNVGSNADEYYENNLYLTSNISIDKIFYTPSQPYIFISSLINVLIDSPKIAVRLVSLISCALLLFYFIKRIKINEQVEKGLLAEKIYRIAFFACAIFITNQMFIGTSDFLSVIFLVLALYYVLKSIKLGKIELSSKNSVIVGVLLGLAIATRPTAVVLIGSFYFSILVILGFQNIFIKQNYIIGFVVLLVFLMINFFPLIEQNKVILDVKEVPTETGVNWFQRNYLMAKFWDEGKIPNTQWISTNDVINYKKENPDFEFPKNQFDFMIKEPGLFCRQLSRMFIKGLYTSYRYMYLLFPLMFLSLIKSNKHLNSIKINNKETNSSESRNRILVIFHLTSIILFSFLAVKLLEFRWLIPSLVLYAFFSVNYLSNFVKEIRFLIYNVSFASGILLYLWFFVTEGF